MKNIISLLFLYLAIYVQPSVAIVAYDCSSQNVTMKSLSLVSTTMCDIPPMATSPSIVKIQVLQRSEESTVHVFQCKVIVTRKISYCGMHSHTSDVHNGFGSYVKEIGRRSCLDAHEYKAFTFSPGLNIDSLQMNASTMVMLTLSGKLSSDGKCSGGSYSDSYGNWDGVVVQASIQIVLNDYYAQIRYSDKSVVLTGGVTCPSNNNLCLDTQNGETYWTLDPYPRCEYTEVTVRYEGPSSKITTIATSDKSTNDTSYMVNTKGYAMWLTDKGIETICGHRVIKTEHPRLLIRETWDTPSPFRNRDLSARDLDLLTYVNTKFISYDRNIKSQLNSMYNDLAYQKCKVEAQVLQGLMSTAVRDPVQFARDYMQMPGYTGVRRNEVIHIIKCIPVDLPVWYGETCYDELPLNHSGTKVYMSPRTHILQSHGTELSCSSVLAGGFQLGSQWFSFNPSRQLQSTPEDLLSSPSDTWQYISPEGLGTAGLYTDSELKTLREDILFPSTRQAVQNNMVRGSLGYNVGEQGINIGNLMDSTSIERIAHRVWTKAWGWFTTLGEWSSGFLGLYIVWVLIKFIFNAVINALTLYELYGFSFRLLAAFKTSVTILCANKAQNSQTNKGLPDRDEPETVQIYPLLPVSEDAQQGPQPSKSNCKQQPYV